jgi:prenyltransferase beta subunit
MRGKMYRKKDGAFTGALTTKRTVQYMARFESENYDFTRLTTEQLRQFEQEGRELIKQKKDRFAALREVESLLIDFKAQSMTYKEIHGLLKKYNIDVKESKLKRYFKELRDEGKFAEKDAQRSDLAALEQPDDD